MKDHTWIPSRGKRLSAMIHTPATSAADAPVVIFCHGFTGDKVGANQLMRNLAQIVEGAGLYAVRFDFAGSGDSEGTFAADTTVAGWQEDLRSVAAWVELRFPGRPVYLLGHSLGGLVVLTATDRPVAGRIAVAPVIHPVENFAVTILGPELWAKSVQGERVANFYGKGFALDSDFTRDLLAAGYDPLAAAAAFTDPLLIVHGTADVAVPFTGSEELRAACAAPAEFAVLDADHVFIGRHEELGAVIVAWLRKQANKQ
ncbi:MAG TPA: alpha/beta fold hydrolase [Negativicutes bacterium]|nr:alpha/beta fold hydrolase [Negativicutes bacterium]